MKTVAVICFGLSIFAASCGYQIAMDPKGFSWFGTLIYSFSAVAWACIGIAFLKVYPKQTEPVLVTLGHLHELKQTPVVKQPEPEKTEVVAL